MRNITYFLTCAIFLSASAVLAQPAGITPENGFYATGKPPKLSRTRCIELGKQAVAVPLESYEQQLNAWGSLQQKNPETFRQQLDRFLQEYDPKQDPLDAPLFTTAQTIRQQNLAITPEFIDNAKKTAEKHYGSIVLPYLKPLGCDF